MHFRIADTFTDSLAKLNGQEQKAAKLTAFELQLDPASPGMKFHKLDRAKDKNFWSVRVNRDLRIIVHRTSDGLLLCYVGHHDDAYRWAERRRLETHPKTGAAQLVEVRERVEEIVVPSPVEAPRPARGPFAGLDSEQLLSVGVPEDWLPAVRKATEDTFFDLVGHLPAEAAEALLEYAATGVLNPPAPVALETAPFEHPDAQRRFRTLTDADELERALEAPWEKWTVFLHPAQRTFAERDYSGPARVSGSAGTGKTVVALHRAVHLARRHPGARILLTTFSTTLANALKRKLSVLTGGESDLVRRITAAAIGDLASDLYREHMGEPHLAPGEIHGELLAAAQEAEGASFTLPFLLSEWTDVVDAWQLDSWEAYRDVPRLGRKTRLGSKQRETLWRIFECVRGELDEQGLVTWPALYSRVAETLGSARAPFDFAVVDEAQDMGVPQLRFLTAIVGDRPAALFFAGDLGQRIFQTPFSWKALGIDVRGRSHTLRVNYRTSHQIRRSADRLLPDAVSDLDGLTEGRRGTTSVFNGPEPDVRILDDTQAETDTVNTWIKALMADGYAAHEIGLFVRSEAELGRARAAADAAGADHLTLSDTVETMPGRISICTMHLAKGLEFRAVAVMACDDEVIPLQERIEAIGDEADLEEVYTTERHLLYVACTRARDRLLITGIDPASEFIVDLVRK